ncbi:MAG: hypothetical protein KDK23_03285 [Leptospiraceae bacterium]|nr:hypothetical protein [Leptospiraceae bacterium]
MIRSILIVLILFSAISAGIMLCPMPVGWRFLACVLLFAFLVGFHSFRNRHRWPELWSMWYFSTMVSLFQVLPDWFLSRVLGVLVFPADGLFKIGSVSAYMAGLWAIPFFLVLLSVRLYESSTSHLEWPGKSIAWSSAGLASLVALVIFGGSEATLWILGSWYAQSVSMIGHVALYVLIPEFLLGGYLYLAYVWSRKKSVPIQILYAVHVSLLYTGALALSYLFFEKVA